MLQLGLRGLAGIKAMYIYFIGPKLPIAVNIDQYFDMESMPNGDRRPFPYHILVVFGVGATACFPQAPRPSENRRCLRVWRYAGHFVARCGCAICALGGLTRINGCRISPVLRQLMFGMGYGGESPA